MTETSKSQLSIEVGFARRQTSKSSFSHFTSLAPDGVNTQASECDLIALVAAHFDEAVPVNEAKTILRVPVPVAGFWSAVRPLRAGDVVRTKFEARRPGETPVLSTVTTGAKAPAKHVEIILYHKDALGKDASTAADWEVVSINASPFEAPYPMDPVTMARNQLREEGGTFQRTYSPGEWAESVWFWATHANVEPEG